MSNQIQFSTFNFHSNAVRIVIDNTSEYWFCAKDVCNILGYLNDSKAIKDHCKEKGVTKRYSLTEGGKQELTFINEPNLYRLIIKSRKPQAEAFEAWVFEEVLPQIRKTGKYEVEPKQLTLPEPTPNFSKAELELLLKLATYAGLYRDYQNEILNNAKEANGIMSRFSEMNGDSYLFVFKPDINRDLAAADKLLAKYVHTK